MADMRFLKSDHERAEFRLAQPLRHLAAQYASLGPHAAVALAGDDEDEGEAIEMRALQENRECAVRMRLCHSMQVEPCFDIAASAQEFRTFAAAKRHQRRRCGPCRPRYGGLLHSSGFCCTDLATGRRGLRRFDARLLPEWF